MHSIKTPILKRKLFWGSLGLLPFSKSAGVATYGYQLLLALSRLGYTPQMRSAGMLGTPSSEQGGGRKLPSSFSPLHDFYFHLLPSLTSSDEPYIYHGLANTNLPHSISVKGNGRFVVTLHDIIPLQIARGRRHSPSMGQCQFVYLLPRALELADVIVCVSEWTRNCLLSYFPQHEEKAVVVFNGLSMLKPTRVQPLVKAVGEKIRLLCVSRWEPYKNLNLLLEMARNRDLVFEIVTDLRGIKTLRSACANIPNVKLSTGLSESELFAKYLNSDVYIQPSLYEGFCLPAYEALNFSKPVLYMKGHALDELFRSGLGVGMPRGATPHDWIGGALEAYKLAANPAAVEKNNNFLQNLPTWHRVAEQMISIYKSLE